MAPDGFTMLIAPIICTMHISATLAVPSAVNSVVQSVPTTLLSIPSDAIPCIWDSFLFIGKTKSLRLRIELFFRLQWLCRKFNLTLTDLLFYGTWIGQQDFLSHNACFSCQLANKIPCLVQTFTGSHSRCSFIFTCVFSAWKNLIINWFDQMWNDEEEWNMGTFLAKGCNIMQCIGINIACYIVTQGGIIWNTCQM